MIAIGKEPEGLLLRKRDVLGWLRGMTEAEWRKIRPSLTEVRLPIDANAESPRATLRDCGCRSCDTTRRGRG